MAIHSSITVWEIPCIEEPGRAQSIGYERINKRVDKMMEDGLLEEVKSLDRFRYKDNVFCPDLLHIPPLRTVGYRELFDYLDGKISIAAAIEKIKTNTRHYAKRQMSYWGRDNNIDWIIKT